jgi:two-component system chemotaxis response regulator CheB
MDNKINVLIVDDSKLVREILKDIFNNDEELRVIGEASNGKEALKLTKRLKPDIITMDIKMPVMDGFEATEQLMAYSPTPILILSSAIDKNEKYTSFKAISLGALDIMSKPDITLEGFTKIADTLITKIKILSCIKVIRHIRGKIKSRILEELNEKTQVAKDLNFKETKFKIVTMGASTGGPIALEKILSAFPADFPIGIIVVQHIANGFIESFIEWLSTRTKLKIKLPANREIIKGGTVYFAPDDVQLTVTKENRIILSREAPAWGEFKPSINHLFKSVAENLGNKAIGVILTGMGKDGAQGMKLMYDNGAFTIAQNEETSMIFGMPKASIDNNCIHSILPIEKIPEEIVRILQE